MIKCTGKGKEKQDRLLYVLPPPPQMPKGSKMDCTQVEKRNAVMQSERPLNAATVLSLVTARKRSLRRLCFYRCLSVHTGGSMRGIIWGGHAWFYLGVCMVLFGGHVWFYLGGVCGFIWGACVVLFRGACVVLFGRHACFYLGGHVWFYLGGVHGFSGEAYVVFLGEGCAWFFQFFRIQ